ncbi:unnamed protein product, partial [Urochloa humidicola]
AHAPPYNYGVAATDDNFFLPTVCASADLNSFVAALLGGTAVGRLRIPLARGAPARGLHGVVLADAVRPKLPVLDVPAVRPRLAEPIPSVRRHPRRGDDDGRAGPAAIHHAQPKQ